MTADQLAWTGLEPGKKGRLVIAGVGQFLQAWNESVWATVESAGTKGVGREASDQVYDKALSELLQWARDHKAKLAEVPPPEVSGTPEADES